MKQHLKTDKNLTFVPLYATTFLTKMFWEIWGNIYVKLKENICVTVYQVRAFQSSTIILLIFCIRCGQLKKQFKFKELGNIFSVNVFLFAPLRETLL